MNLAKRTFSDLLHFIYPQECICCGDELATTEENLCSLCLNELHFTNYEHYKDDSSVDKLFWGRVEVENVFSLLYYKGNTQSKKILYHLKYSNRPDLALFMGKMIGEHLKGNEQFQSIDLLVPVPIHDKKRYIRGYNQSEKITQGINEILNKKTDYKFAQKSIFHESQTKKNKFQRWDNVQNTFVISDSLSPDIHHIAIIDDVLTTGSTIETLMHAILEKHNIKLSVITIAYAG